jgi:glutamate-1-semialdehyde 2,1-aminomutase
MLRTTRSNKLFLKAQSLIPGGANFPELGFRAVGRPPLFVKKASAAYIWDQDGNKFVDYVGSRGSMILGHANPGILKAVRTAARSGTSFGAPTQLELRLAEFITKVIPSVEMVRIVNSGAEAMMGAFRLARTFTRRENIIAFEGCGQQFDADDGSADDTMKARFNDLESVRELLRQHPGQVAAIAVEPVATAMGCIPPLPGFLQGIRTLCDEHGSLLIFDEGVTGFRVAMGGGQELYGVRPDLTTLGMILGGGLPLGACGGRKDVMMQISPAGSFNREGSPSGNPLAMAAGYQMLRILASNKLIYKRLEQHATWLEEGMRDILGRAGIGHTFNRVGSMFTLFFTKSPVIDHATAATTDSQRFSRYFNAMLESGVYLPPSQLETAFLSTAHTERIIDTTLRAAARAVRRL